MSVFNPPLNLTGNPIGSDNPLDRDDNYRVFDVAFNSTTEESVLSRQGVELATLYGLQQQVSRAIAAIPASNGGTGIAGLVAPEFFGAVGDGIADDTTAIINADVHAKSIGGQLVGYGTYKITRQVLLTCDNVRFNTGGLILAAGFPDDVAIVRPSRLPFAKVVDHEIYINGNIDNQTRDITLIKHYALPSAGNRCVFTFRDCHTGLHVSGNTERAFYDVWAFNTVVAVRETEQLPLDSTPDEIVYTISGGNIGQGFVGNSESAKHIIFNVEQGGATGAHFIDIVGQEGKPVTISGVVRELRNGAFTIKGGFVILADFVIYTADGADSYLDCQSVSGNVTFIGTRKGLHIERCVRPSTLDINIHSCAGTPVTFGSVNRDVSNSTFNINVSLRKGAGPLFKNNNSQNCTFNLNVMLNGDAGQTIDLGSNTNSIYNVSYPVLKSKIPVITTSSAPYNIAFVGRHVMKNDLTAYPKPVKGMRVTSFESNGALAIYTGKGATGWQKHALTDL